MVDLGFFADERLELLEGILVAMSPQSGRHATSVRRLTMLLAPRLIGRAEVQVQLPLAVTDDSEPEPDIAAVPSGDYVTQHPTRAFLVVEVADSSLKKDRAKARIYARSGVPEYWIVDLDGDAVEVYREPEGGSYRVVTRHTRDATLTLLAFPDVTLKAGELLLPR